MSSESEKQTAKIAYPLNDSLYLNITNRCSNACVFCIRQTKKGVGYNLWLEKEPTTEEIIEAVGDPSIYKEVVFCGYGEPLLRPEVVVGVSKALKEKKAKKIRLNTNGLAGLFLEEDILPKLSGLIDEISISLNAHNAIVYQELTQSKYGLKSYDAVREFAKRSVEYIPEVVLTVVDYPGVDIHASKKIAEEVGAIFRLRQLQK